ncbi:hypothetical protein EGW08_004223 [Elysia chlorotica]|uniref:Pseudouridylate synthase 1 homolog n=1 Tax=Elysia chlorotica TaxID=188477 RepID=A0A3S1BNW2_ELYCH|nr:hypothetical protein EGW08_004223 [Elysia chlorotica]
MVMLKRVSTFLQRIRQLYPKVLTMSESVEAQPSLLGKHPTDHCESTEPVIPKKKKKNHVVQLGKSEGFKRKIALMIAYNGAGYYGVQVNPGFPTIESEFFPALVKIKAIPEDHATTPSKMWFQRGSRTDKGVSAAGQIFSLKAVLVPDFVNKLNEILPPAIRVIGYIRTTNGFDSKNFCCARTYMYMLPTFAFAPIEKFVTDDYRTTAEITEKVRKILMRFQGTHKFHNFTSGVKFEQASAARYIIKFECSDPYIREGMEFVTLRVKGQSFMLHHIRKMIGLTIAIVRGYCGESVIDSCWGPEKVDVPKAPGLGLVLEQLHFDGYNKKFGKDGVHDPIDWSSYGETVEQFKEEQIISQIVAKEKTERVTFEWLRTLQFHNFDTPRTEGPQKPWVPLMKMLKESDRNVDVKTEEKGMVSETVLENSVKLEVEADDSSLPKTDGIKAEEGMLSETSQQSKIKSETQAVGNPSLQNTDGKEVAGCLSNIHNDGQFSGNALTKDHIDPSQDIATDSCNVIASDQSKSKEVTRANDTIL